MCLEGEIFTLGHTQTPEVYELRQSRGCWNLPTSGGARSKVGGGQKEGILSKNPYFEGILVKF